MPKSKTRRKSDRRSVAGPTPVVFRETPEQQRLREEREVVHICAAYEHLAEGRLPVEIIAERAALQHEQNRRNALGEDLSVGQEGRLVQLDNAVKAAIPDKEVMRFLIVRYDYGRSEEWAVPSELYWDQRQ